jgi:hypothetical protein
MKRNTVNVIEIVDGIVQSLRAWDDDQVGNAEAEKVFHACVTENTKGDAVPPDDADMNGYVEDGTFEQGTYQVNLVHSTN